MASYDEDVDQAIHHLNTAWNDEHDQRVDAWNREHKAKAQENECQRLERREAEEEQRRIKEAEIERERKEAEKKKPKINDFNENRPPPGVIALQPSQYALQKLVTYDYVELWYFSPEGCTDASHNYKSHADDAFGITSSNDVLTLRPVASIKASHFARADHDLNFSELLQAKNTLLQLMKPSWPSKHVNALAEFFWNLENHPIRHNENDDRIALLYASRIRRQWHDDLKINNGSAFNIALISEALMSSTAFKVNSSIQAAATRKVSLFSYPPNPCTNFSPFRPPSLPRCLLRPSSPPNGAAVLPHHYTRYRGDSALARPHLHTVTHCLVYHFSCGRSPPRPYLVVDHHRALNPPPWLSTTLWSFTAARTPHPKNLRWRPSPLFRPPRPPATGTRAATTANVPNQAGNGEETPALPPPPTIGFVNRKTPHRPSREPPPPPSSTVDGPRATPSNQHAPCASATTPTAFTNAMKPHSGTAPPLSHATTQRVASSTRVEPFCAATGKNQTDATCPTSQPSTNAQAAETPNTGLKNVIELRRAQARTPYKPEAWRHLLDTANLTHRYPSIYNGLRFSFTAGIPPLSHTFSPPNNPSIIEHSRIFKEIVDKEFTKGRYIGPLSHTEVENALGPFQTAPLSLVPKPGKPGKFRLVQNLSFPLYPYPSPSINSLVDPDNFPSPYSTFSIVVLILSSLPPDPKEQSVTWRKLTGPFLFTLLNGMHS